MKGSVPAAGPTVNEEQQLSLSGEEAALIAAEATSASHALGEPLRTDATRLVEAAKSGEVPPELIGILSDIVVASLQGGRARRLYRAEGEKSLTGVLLKTPAGREMQRSLEEVNEALTALAGRSLEAVRVSMRTPGSFTVSLRSEGVAITLAMTDGVVSVESLSA
jgi:hypothetical protein